MKRAWFVIVLSLFSFSAGLAEGLNFGDSPFYFNRDNFQPRGEAIPGMQGNGITFDFTQLNAVAVRGTALKATAPYGAHFKVNYRGIETPVHTLYFLTDARSSALKMWFRIGTWKEVRAPMGEERRESGSIAISNIKLPLSAPPATTLSVSLIVGRDAQGTLLKESKGSVEITRNLGKGNYVMPSYGIYGDFRGNQSAFGKFVEYFETSFPFPLTSRSKKFIPRFEATGAGKLAYHATVVTRSSYCDNSGCQPGNVTSTDLLDVPAGFLAPSGTLFKTVETQKIEAKFS